MKVLQVSTEATWRGGEQQIAYLINGLQNSGVEVHVLSRKGSDFSKWCAEQVISHSEAPFKNSTDLKSIRILKALAIKGNFDLIHFHSGKGHGLYALSTLIGNTVPAILSRRVDFPIKNNPWASWKYNLSQIKKILCVSDAIRKMMQAAVKDTEKCITVHSGIDLSRFNDVLDLDLRAEYNIPSERILIGNVAALAPHKDYSTFLRTARKCLDSGLSAHFLIIGEGGQRSYIESQISQLDLSSHVTMTGFRKDIPAVLKALDLFLITSETEGLGTSILDAFASDLPVIATAAGGIPELVQHEKTGLLNPVKDEVSLSQSVIRLAKDQVLQAELTRAAKKHLSAFTKESVADKTHKIYLEALNLGS